MPNNTPKVFLDANILIAAGKPPGGPEIQRVIDLVEAEIITILATDLTVTEVAKKHAENDYEVIRDIGRAHFRSILELVTGVPLPIVSKAELKSKLIKTYETSTNEMFKSLKAKMLAIDGIKPSTILAAYAANEGFFSGEGKKNQFPDAFIFESLKAEASESTRVIIVSNDGDFINPATSVPNISLVMSLPALFGSLGLEMDAPEIDEFLEENKGTLIEKIGEELSNWGLIGDVEDSEVYDIDPIDVEIENMTAFKGTEEGGSILVIGRLAVKADLYYSHPDWDTASYDSEDKVLIPWDTVTGETTVDVTIDVSMSVAIDDDGEPTAVETLDFRNGNFQYVQLHPYENYK
ncbi:PIN domain-containing protein [Allomesorhizobium alhagi]|uniref:DUF4935 domain-containing protein n=1 Tax=Mesorhizobium alhagi CCNWXJ12-2 TaxID=1107882 RepID=H0HM87_9HYPH|nr:PIN domain-containing protein [Mesorhizobium alhagi]EHK58172.1 hypothetical protein MAXJ12_06253 [Mesorhizobium alhagi CCNWXJ12-2]